MIAIQYGQTIIIGLGLLLGLAAIALYRIWTSDKKYTVRDEGTHEDRP